MKVLKATIEQKKALEGEYDKGAILQFIEDKNNNWVVNTSVLNDLNFEKVWVQLMELELIEFEQKEVSDF